MTAQKIINKEIKIMKIVVYGSGCKSCETLYGRVLSVLREKNAEADAEYVKDLAVIISKGIMQLPALEVDGKIVVSGRVPKESEIAKLLG